MHSSVFVKRFPCFIFTKYTVGFQQNATKTALRFLSERFSIESATTYFHAPFPANYLGHE